jgi:flagellar assembly protein FliH
MSSLHITQDQEGSKAELDEATSYQTWKIPSFNTDHISIHSSKSNTRVTLPEDENIARIFEATRQEAYEKGMQEGFTVGLAKARSVASDDKEILLQLMNTFTDALEQADEKIAGDVLALALDIAKAMLKVKLEVDPAVILPIVADAIHYLPSIQQPARILLHRDDAQMLREYLTEDTHNWQIQEDAHIERGGCMVDTRANHIDVSNPQRWKRISDALAQHNDWLLP